MRIKKSYLGISLTIAALTPFASVNAQTQSSCEILTQVETESCYERAELVGSACSAVGAVGGALVIEELIENEFLENIALVIYGEYLEDGCEVVEGGDLETCLSLVDNRVAAADPSCAEEEQPPTNDGGDSGEGGDDEDDIGGDNGDLEDLIDELIDADVEFTDGNDWPEGEVTIEDFIEEL